MKHSGARILLISLWTLGFQFGFGVLIAGVISSGYEKINGIHLVPSFELLVGVGALSGLMGAVGLLLGVLGLLPGTRKERT